MDNNQEIKTARSFWVFGYGSLMWRPGFDYIAKSCAILDDHNRHFCLRSIRYRGTPEHPGLVLGLDRAPGRYCRGIAYKVSGRYATEVIDYLRERELGTYSYDEVTRRIRLINGTSGRTRAEVDAICYIIKQDHAQYAGHLTLLEQAEIIAHAEGPAGTNRDYLMNTVMHLHELGVEDKELEMLAELVNQIFIEAHQK